MAVRHTSSQKPKAAPRRRGALGTYFARTKIIEGAAKVFADKGADDATVEDILRTSRISRRTFYRFFANKEEVLDALFEVALNLFVRAFQEAVAAPDPQPEKPGARPRPLARIERLVDVYLGFSR